MAENGGLRPPERVLSSAVAKDLRRIGSGEVDFSRPFASVREAVDRFGGSNAAFWKPQLGRLQFSPEEVDLMKVEEQTVKVEMDLFVKERETMEVLKELEMTKRIACGLQLQLQKQVSKFSEINPEIHVDTMKVHPISFNEKKCPIACENRIGSFAQDSGIKQSPGLILLELKRAKANLNRTTNGFSGNQSSIEQLKGKIEEEKVLLKKTHERFISNTTMIPILEQDLSRKFLELKEIKDAGGRGSKNSPDKLSQIKQLNIEKEKYRKMTEAAKSEVCNLTAEIEQTTYKIKASEVRWITAKKMEEAARSAEKIALKETKALTDCKNSCLSYNTSEVKISIEEYAMLIRKAKEADELSKRKLDSVMHELKVAQQSKLELFEKVEEVTTEIEASKRALEQALKREEVANKGKLAAEAALQKWRSEHATGKRLFQNTTKFKNVSSTPHRKVYQILDVNGSSLISGGSSNVMKATLSIGQILSSKLTGLEDHEAQALQKINGKPKVSLRQILSKKHEHFSSLRIDDGVTHKQISVKRKKFGLFALSLLLAKQNKKKRNLAKKSSRLPEI